MAVGYSLGNKSNIEGDINVLGEDGDNIITYSHCLDVVLSRLCRNGCPYCGFNRNDNLTVPYSIIRKTKAARLDGVREVYFEAGERPDSYPYIRSILDLWGFKSYLDYIYTICELAFLEGLIPIIDIGFLTPEEMKRLSEVCAAVKMMLDPVCKVGTFKKRETKKLEKKLEYRIKSLEWAGKLSFPTITGIIVGLSDSKSQYVELLKVIASSHQKYNHIHEVVLQNFVPVPGTPLEHIPAPTKKEMINSVELAFEYLPSDVSVIVPLNLNLDIGDFIDAGIRDLGRVYYEKAPHSIDNLKQIVSDKGFSLQQRFPLRKSYIKEGFYSKKLGQVFESYRYRIKKEEQERIKEAKLNESGN